MYVYNSKNSLIHHLVLPVVCYWGWPYEMKSTMYRDIFKNHNFWLGDFKMDIFQLKTQHQLFVNNHYAFSVYTLHTMYYCTLAREVTLYSWEIMPHLDTGPSAP